MTVRDFPAVHNAETYRQAERDANTAKSQAAAEHEELAYKARSYWLKHSRKGKAKGGKISLLGIPVAAGVAYLIMTLAAVAAAGATAVASAGMAIPFILLAVVFIVLFNILSRKHVRKKHAELEKKAGDRLALGDTEAEKIKAAAQDKAQEYIDAFWNEAQKMSLRFAESAAADAIAQWAMGHFSRLIDSADRSSHLEYVEVNCRFTVFPHKVDLGQPKSMKKPETADEIIAAKYGHDCPRIDTWDFEERRCQELTSPLEQAALAHALSSKLQLETMIAYPEDACGSAVEIVITRNTTSETAIVNIGYRAANLNYQAIKSW